MFVDRLDQGRPSHKGHLAKLGRDEQEQEEITNINPIGVSGSVPIAKCYRCVVAINAFS